MRNKDNHVILYDSTLRDGAQARGVDFTVADKRAIAEALDDFGVDYVEGGWPGANPNDDAFFASPPKMKRGTLTAFGMTRRAGRSAANDPGLATLLDAKTKSLCIVGKSWDKQVVNALGISKAENIKMIGESIALLAGKKIDVHFDAEHFFDGYKANPVFALECLTAAHEAGAAWLVLCDTNGGSMPDEVERIVSEVKQHLPKAQLGIHCHNDTENAVANSLAAVRGGARQVQGTINGVGERCGNANLIAIIPNLMLKMGYATNVKPAKLKHLTQLSRLLDERLNRPSNAHAAYVGEAAFAHKGGLHVSAMAKDSTSYEHIEPESVGNARVILVSDKAGRSNILERLKDFNIRLDADDDHIKKIVSEVKQREKMGYAYEGADSSFELLVRRILGGVPSFFTVDGFRVMGERRHNAKGRLTSISEATIRLNIDGKTVMTVDEGNGPVSALDGALRKALVPHFPSLKHLMLMDYKVRILTPEDGTEAVTRVLIESRDHKGNAYHTLGVSGNIIDASFNALEDAIVYFLWKKKS